MRKNLTTLLSLAFTLVGLAILPSLAAAQACPDPGLPPLPGVEANGQLAQGMQLPVLAGGNLDLASCMDVPGTGFVAQAADYELSVDGNTTGDDLEIRVAAPCDAILLVNDSSGTWHFSDDEDGGSLPRIVIPNGANGVYDIWVGTYDGASCDATLTLQTFVAGTTAPTSAMGNAGICPDITFDAPILSYDIGLLATPQVTSVVAGGDTNLGECPDVPGTGYIVRNPDFQMDLSGNAAGQDVQVRVDAVCDAILLINDATATWQYNDDTDGTNPVITLPAAIDGSYDIWVGTLGQENCEATLTISAVGTQPVKGQPPVVNATPDPGNLTAFRENVGEVMTFAVTGLVDGTVYGTGNYTDDSDLSSAAVHAGVLAVGQTGVVTVQMTGPAKAYEASSQNGVDSVSYGSWQGSYMFVQ